jgi:plastocyanin
MLPLQTGKPARSSQLLSRGIAALTIVIVAVVALVAVGFLFYSGLTPTTSSEVEVVIPKGASENASLGFEPSNITVVIGVNNTVVWKNEDSDWHTAHSDGPEFNSGLIQPGGSFTHTFQRAGTYPYHCDPHPWMTGVVTVKAATSTGIVTYRVYEELQKPTRLRFASLVKWSVEARISREIALALDFALP